MTKTVGREVFAPIESFSAKVDGDDVTFVEGQTLVREGHPVLDQYGHLFKPVRVRFDVEQATAAPGETRKR